MTNQSELSSRLQPILKTLNERVNSGRIEVPLLPEVAGKAVRLTQDPDSDSAQLANLIQSDQTLAAHVMRVANSAAYSPNATLVSLQQAITRLGMKVIAEIALASSVNSSLFNAPGYDKDIQAILRLSLGAGLWAKESARIARKNVEAAFLAGLLNDIGRPAAIQAILAIASEQGISLEKPEVYELIEVCQRQIGIKVVEIWEMPSAVKDVVMYIDDYTQEHSNQLQTQIVYAGKTIAKHFMCEKGTEACPTREELMAHPVFPDINLYPDEIEKLLEREDAVSSAMEAMGQ